MLLKDISTRVTLVKTWNHERVEIGVRVQRRKPGWRGGLAHGLRSLATRLDKQTTVSVSVRSDVPLPQREIEGAVGLALEALTDSLTENLSALAKREWLEEDFLREFNKHPVPNPLSE